jgi:hypothetical protein
MMAGKEVMRLRTAIATWQSAAAIRDRAGGKAGSDKGLSVSASRICLLVRIGGVGLHVVDKVPD